MASCPLDSSSLASRGCSFLDSFVSVAFRPLPTPCGGGAVHLPPVEARPSALPGASLSRSPAPGGSIGAGGEEAAGKGAPSSPRTSCAPAGAPGETRFRNVSRPLPSSESSMRALDPTPTRVCPLLPAVPPSVSCPIVAPSALSPSSDMSTETLGRRRFKEPTPAVTATAAAS